MMNHGRDLMEIRVSNATIELLKCYRKDLGLEIPIRKDSDIRELFYNILQYFTSLEASISMTLDCTDFTEEDFQLWNDVANAVDEFNLPEEDSIDIDDLNRRLMGSNPLS